MRRRDPVRIGDALNDFFSSTPVIARKIAEAKIPDLWPVLVGNVIASYTTKIELRTGGRLFVHLSSSVARNEVFMRRSALMDAIIKAKPATAKGQYVKSITLASTMGPGVKVAVKN